MLDVSTEFKTVINEGDGRNIRCYLLIYFDATPVEVTCDDYLMNVEWKEEVSADDTLSVGNVSANEMTFYLDNDDRRFSPDNASGLYAGKIRTGVKVEIYASLMLSTDVYENILVGTYYVSDWTASLDDVQATVTAYDRLYTIRNIPTPALPVVYNKTYKELYQLLFGAIGLTEDDYEFDNSAYTETVPYGFVLGEKVGETLEALSLNSFTVVYVNKRNNKIRVAALKKPETSTITNLVANGNFATSDGWTVPNGSIVAPNTCQINQTGPGDSYIYKTTRSTIPAGHKIFYRCKVKSLGLYANEMYLEMYDPSYNLGARVLIGGPLEQNQWTNVGTVVTLTRDVNMFANFVPCGGYPTAIQYQEIFLLDLTAIHGTGSEPTVEEAVILYPTWFDIQATSVTPVAAWTDADQIINIVRETSTLNSVQTLNVSYALPALSGVTELVNMQDIVMTEGQNTLHLTMDIPLRQVTSVKLLKCAYSRIGVVSYTSSSITITINTTIGESVSLVIEGITLQLSDLTTSVDNGLDNANALDIGNSLLQTESAVAALINRVSPIIQTIAPYVSVNSLGDPSLELLDIITVESAAYLIPTTSVMLLRGEYSYDGALEANMTFIITDVL